MNGPCFQCGKDIESTTAPAGHNVGKGPKYTCAECCAKMSTEDTILIVETAIKMFEEDETGEEEE